MKTSDTLYQWPKWMPLPQQNDYGYSLTDRRSKTDMEVGSVLRVNFDTDEGTVDCSIICDCTQSLWFENFEQNTLRQGATWFKMPIQIAGAIEWHNVRFASRPNAKIKGPNHTTYSFKLEIDDRDLWFCKELASLLSCISPKELLKSASFFRSSFSDLKKLQFPDWECWENEKLLSEKCPSSVQCAEAAISLFVDNIKHLKD